MITHFISSLISKNLTLAFLSIAVLLCSFTNSTYADSVSIQNNISVSATSGGNSSSNQSTVHTGSSSVRVFTETRVNGETLQYIDKRVSGIGQAFEINEVRTNASKTATVLTNIAVSTKPSITLASTTISKQNLKIIPARITTQTKKFTKTTKPEVKITAVDNTPQNVVSAVAGETKPGSAVSGASESFISIIFNYIKHALSIF